MTGILMGFFLMAGGLFHKIKSCDKDANNVTNPGTYFVNLYTGETTNYPSVKDIIILEVFIFTSSTNIYIVQRATCFNGSIYSRSKTNTADWTTWVK